MASTNPELVGQTLDISAAEASALWSTSTHVPDTNYVYRSENGLWAVRNLTQASIFDSKLPFASQYESIKTELDLFESFGGLVISHGITCDEKDGSVYAVAPWVEGLTKVTEAAYKDRVVPVLLKYFVPKGILHEEPPANDIPFLGDIEVASQYSTLPGEIETPFLHDIDVYTSVTSDPYGAENAYSIWEHLEEFLEMPTEEIS